MDKIGAMKTFVQIIESGSLTRAADSLGTSLPTVVRTLAALERELGVSLLKRTTRRIHITDEARSTWSAAATFSPPRRKRKICLSPAARSRWASFR